MKENRNDPAMPDRILAQMAQETPEMPADFHDRWTRAVRAEAAQQKQTEKRKDSRRQWRYLLSAAAVFVFLIGGTLLTRNTPRNSMTDSAVNGAKTAAEERWAEPAAAMGMAADDGIPAATMMPTPEIYASNSLVSEAAEAMEADLYTAAEEPAAEAASEMVSERKTAAKTAPAAGNGFTAAGAGTSEAMIMEASGTAPAEAAEEAAAADAEEAEEEAAEAAWTAAETADETAEEETEEAAGESGFVSFLKDLGLFTLKTLAVAAAGAVLAFGAAALHKAWKKKKGQGAAK